MIGSFRHIVARRRILRDRFDVARSFKQIEETCIPSYLHHNPAAAGIAWLRLFTAARLYRRYAAEGPILDFGAATGELGHLLVPKPPYEFIESDHDMAAALLAMQPGAARRRLEELPPSRYAAVFALDSLEHNDDVAGILQKLTDSVRPGGILIISGPTENFFYRLGRKLAHFDGSYHKTTIYHIEAIARDRLMLLHRRIVPGIVPLFAISVWRVGERGAH